MMSAANLVLRSQQHAEQKQNDALTFTRSDDPL